MKQKNKEREREEKTRTKSSDESRFRWCVHNRFFNDFNFSIKHAQTLYTPENTGRDSSVLWINKHKMSWEAIRNRRWRCCCCCCRLFFDCHRFFIFQKSYIHPCWNSALANVHRHRHIKHLKIYDVHKEKHQTNDDLLVAKVFGDDCRNGLREQTWMLSMLDK